MELTTSSCGWPALAGDQRLHAYDGDTGTVIYAGGGTNELMSGHAPFNTGIVARGRIYFGADNKIYAFNCRQGHRPPHLQLQRRLLLAPGGTNVALAARMVDVASASSTYDNNFPVMAVNDGDRLGLNFGYGGLGRNELGTPNVWPDWVEIDFNAGYPINEIDFFTLQDNYQNPSPPQRLTCHLPYTV